MSAPVTLKRIATSRSLRAALAGCAIVVALAGAVGAVQGWRASAGDRSVQRLYAGLRWSASREQTRLRAAAKPPRTAKARTRFFASARQTAKLLARLPATAPAADTARVLRIETRHEAALAAAASALGGRVSRPGDLRRAVALLEDVKAQSVAGQMSGARTRPASWPSTAVERIETGDMALVLLIGLLSVVRTLRRSAGLEPQDRAEHPELESLRRAAHSDTLTGLANRRAFDDDLAKLIGERNASGTPFSLVAVDLNELKQVNDGHGHEAGDAYICAAAEALSVEIGSAGTVYRTGGDEFMALLPNMRGWHALVLAHNVQRRASEATGRRALSIGITESTSTESRRELLREADRALYEAKRARLLAVTYHAGLEPHAVQSAGSRPSEHQKALAAALARAVDTKDADARHHSETVSELSVAVARRLGVEGDRLERIRIAGLLHDVGKIGVSDAILQKLVPLTQDERSELEIHVTVGHSILSSAELREEARWVLHHHERFDGTGYPSGLVGEAIPLESRIIAVADAFEAMTGARPYRETMIPDEALAELVRHSGTQFDPECVQALADVSGDIAGSQQQARPAAGQPVVALRAEKKAS
jgi:diguanylate cyclase (GGDEF)-like protein